MGALFALAGVLVGVLVTSGYSFWSTRRQELMRGSTAVRALDDEAHWLSQELSRAVRSGRVMRLDAAVSVEVWREQREALMLWAKVETSRQLGDAFRECERWEEAVSGAVGSTLEPAQVEAAKAALAELSDAQLVLGSLADYLWSEHEIFILTTLFRMIGRSIQRTMGRDPGWHPPAAQAGLG